MHLEQHASSFSFILSGAWVKMRCMSGIKSAFALPNI